LQSQWLLLNDGKADWKKHSTSNLKLILCSHLFVEEATKGYCKLQQLYKCKYRVVWTPTSAFKPAAAMNSIEETGDIW